MKSKTYRKCTVDGCESPHLAKGYCQKHYSRVRNGITNMCPETLGPGSWKPDDIRYLRGNRNKTCEVTGCESHVYAKNLCRSHYNIKLRTGDTVKKKDIPKPICKADGCNKVSKTKGFCIFHYNRHRRGIKFDRPKGVKGELNPRWNNGNSQYPNHHILKKNRLIVLERDNYTCQYCGAHTKQVHHIDLRKDNHDINNLKACCHSCNLKMVKSRKKTNSRFLRKYGITAKELAKEMRCSLQTIYVLAKMNKLEALPRLKDIDAVLF